MEVRQTICRSHAPATAAQKLEVEEKIKKMRKESEKMIKGMFEFVDAQGGWIDFSYRFLPGDPVTTVKITHGEIIDVPLMLARHLNNVYKKVRIPPKEIGENGRPLSGGSLTKISRTRFTPLDIM